MYDRIKKIKYIKMESNLQNLTNEQIIDYLEALTQSVAYRDLIKELNNLYDETLEMRPLDIELLSLTDRFSVDQLINYFSATNDQGYESLIIDLLEGYQNDANITVYIKRLERVFDFTYSEDFIRDLLDAIDVTNMSGVGISNAITYYENKLKEIAEFAPKPEYVKIFDIDVDKLPMIKHERELDELNDELIADMLLLSGQINIEVPETDNPRDFLIAYLETMNIEDKMRLASHFIVDPEMIKNVRRNKDIFRVYGPCNPYQDMDFAHLTDENGDYDPNIVYGGARMFTDTRLEYDYDDDVPLDTWFTGSCNWCSRRIKQINYAVREPVISGGWRSCYCSWNCVREKVKNDLENLNDDENAILEMGAISLGLIKVIEEDMNNIGIAEREQEEEVEGPQYTVTLPEPEKVEKIPINKYPEDIEEAE